MCIIPTYTHCWEEKQYIQWKINIFFYISTKAVCSSVYGTLAEPSSVDVQNFLVSQIPRNTTCKYSLFISVNFMSTYYDKGLPTVSFNLIDEKVTRIDLDLISLNVNLLHQMRITTINVSSMMTKVKIFKNRKYDANVEVKLKRS